MPCDSRASVGSSAHSSESKAKAHRGLGGPLEPRVVESVEARAAELSSLNRAERGEGGGAESGADGGADRGVERWSESIERRDGTLGGRRDAGVDVVDARLDLGIATRERGDLDDAKIELKFAAATAREEGRVDALEKILEVLVATYDELGEDHMASQARRELEEVRG